MTQPYGWNLSKGKMYMIPLMNTDGNAIHRRWWRCVDIIYPNTHLVYPSGAYTLRPIKPDTGEQYLKGDMPNNYIYGVDGNFDETGVTYRWKNIGKPNYILGLPPDEHLLQAAAAAANITPRKGGRTKRLRRRRRRRTKRRRRRRTKRRTKRRRKRRSRRGRRHF